MSSDSSSTFRTSMGSAAKRRATAWVTGWWSAHQTHLRGSPDQNLHLWRERAHHSRFKLLKKKVYCPFRPKSDCTGLSRIKHLGLTFDMAKPKLQQQESSALWLFMYICDNYILLHFHWRSFLLPVLKGPSVLASLAGFPTQPQLCRAPVGAFYRHIKSSDAVHKENKQKKFSPSHSLHTKNKLELKANE